MHPADLGAHTLKALVERVGVDPAAVEDVVYGCVDAIGPQAVAGVMGGGTSEVTAATTRIVFESAYFKPASVRRTSKRLGLKSEASARFERGTDINGPLAALTRALDLMEHQVMAALTRERSDSLVIVLAAAARS